MATKFPRLAIVQTRLLLRFGRCYSMQLARFWYKPLARFNCSIPAQLKRTACHCVSTVFALREKIWLRFPEKNSPLK